MCFRNGKFSLTGISRLGEREVNTLGLVSVPMMERVRDKVNKLYGRNIQDGQ